MITWQLTRGLKSIILIDDEDVCHLEKYIINTAQLSPHHRTRYVVLRSKITRKYVTLLHRAILGINDPNIIIDHRNGNGLDCQKDNLRIATFSQNNYNRRRSVNEVKGVYWREDRQKWYAILRANNKLVLNKSFVTYEEAVAARLEAERLYHGSFAGYGTEHGEHVGNDDNRN